MIDKILKQKIMDISTMDEMKDIIELVIADVFNRKKRLVGVRLHSTGEIYNCTGSCKDCMVCYPKYGETHAHCAIFELTKKAQGKTRS